MSKKLKKETENILASIVGTEEAFSIMANMFPPPLKGYIKGDLISVGELRLLKEGDIIFVKYFNEDNHVSVNDFLTFGGIDSDEAYTTDGYPFPLEGHRDNELIESFDNCDHTFTIYKAIKNKV